MGNQLSSPGTGRTRKLVLAAAGSGIAATALAWKCGYFQFQRSKKPKEMTKESNNSPQENRIIFADLCALMVVIGTLRLMGVNDLSKISTAGTNHEESINRQILPNQPTSTSLDSNSINGASQLRDKVCDSISSAPKEIKIMTYNLCHPQKNSLHARMLAITLLVQTHMPDVVLFQEVTSQMREILRGSGMCDPYKFVAEGSNCIVLSKLATNSLHSVPFSKGGELLLCKTEFNNGYYLFIATSHLKRSSRRSRAATKGEEKRMSQAKEAIEKLHHYPNVIFGGDMNWITKDGLFPLEPGWIDAWEQIRPHEQGYTFDTENNPLLKGRKTLRERLDRFLCNLNNFELVDIEIVGKEGIPVVVPCESAGVFQNQSVIVSDHYGLIVTVRAL